MRIRLTLDIFREPKPEPEHPVIYDLAGAHVERADQWDHDTRPPVGFSRGEL